MASEMMMRRKLTSCPVGQTVLDAVARELGCTGLGEDKVTLKARIDDLGNDVAVGDADDQAVLGRVAEDTVV